MNESKRQIWLGLVVTAAVIIGTAWGCQAHKRMVAMELAAVEAALAVDSALQASSLARSPREVDRLSTDQQQALAEQRAAMDRLAEQLTTDLQREDQAPTPDALKNSAQALNAQTDKVLAIFGRRLEPARDLQAD